MEREQDNAAAERKRPKRDRDHPPLEGRFRHGFRLLCLCCFGGKALHNTAGGWPHFPKGGETMRITMHIGSFTVTIIIKKRKNRHSAK